MPLEAQGRGFAHGHKKIIALPNYSAASLVKLFQADEPDVRRMIRTMREQVLDAVVSVHYDTATLPAEQLGIAVLPEPFSRQQQRQSRLDGGDSNTSVVSRLCFFCNPCIAYCPSFETV